MAAKKWIYEVKYTDGEEYAYTAPDGKLKSKKLPTVRVEAENRLNAVVAAAQKWGVGCNRRCTRRRVRDHRTGEEERRQK